MRRESEENNKKTSRSDGIYIPLDLTGEILSRLPVKSTVRFKCVSKLWLSLITDSIMTWPLAKPRLLVVFDQPVLESSVFSLSGCLLNTYKEPISPEQDNYGLNFNKTYQYTRGLMCCLSSYGQFVIYNPTTRQSFLLPKIQPKTRRCVMDGFFGYDPIENQYKVLCMIRGKYNLDDSYKVFKLGDPKKQWRNIQGFNPCISPTMTTRVCINGKIYSRASLGRYVDIPIPNSSRNVLLSFDVRSERFDHIEIPNQCRSSTLVNYQGKLGCIRYSIYTAEMWVMGDETEKQKWSKYIFSMSEQLMESLEHAAHIVGVTFNGEVVVIPKKLTYGETLYAYYYDPKQNNTKIVDLKRTFKEELKYKVGVRVFCVPDHVEYPMSLLELFH